MLELFHIVFLRRDLYGVPHPFDMLEKQKRTNLARPGLRRADREPKLPNWISLTKCMGKKR